VCTVYHFKINAGNDTCMLKIFYSLITVYFIGLGNQLPQSAATAV
jgi:hypothetical protein